MKKLLLALVAVIVIVIVAALVAPFLIPTDTYKSKLIALVKQSTGRDLTISGPVKLSFLPQLQIEAADVALANAPGAHDPQMLQLKQLQITLRLLPLISGRVELGRFVLDHPVISLEVMRDGRPNWAFSTPQPGPRAVAPAAPSAPVAPSAPAPAASGGGSSASLSGLSLEDVRLVSGKISYLDDRTGKSQTVDDINMKLSLPNLDSPFAGEGSAVWNGQTVALSIGVAKPRALMTGAATDIGLHVAAKPINFGFTGQMTGAPPTRLDGAVDVTVPSLRELAAWVGSPLPPGGGLGPFAIKGKLALKSPQMAFTDATITLDAIKGTGALTIDTGGARPALKGQLALDKLDLNPYLPPESKPGATAPAPTAPAPTAPAAGGGGKPGAPAPAAAPSTGWSDAPIDVSGLKVADADFDLRTGGIIYRKIVVGTSALDLHLKDGKLTANLSQLSLYQGKGTGNVMVDGSGGVPAIAMKFDLSGVQIGPLLEAAANSDRLTGVGKVSFDVTGTGKSQRAIVGALNGKGALDLANGQVKGVNLIALAQNATSALTGAKADDATNFGTLTGTFTITNGVLHNNDMQLKSGPVPVTGAGTVNLPQRTVDYRVVASGIPIAVTGPWDDLSYQPDLGAALQGLGKQPGKVLEQLKDLGGSGTGSGSSPGNLLKGLFGK